MPSDRKAFVTITGVSMAITNAGAMAGPLFAGFMYDVRDSYLSALLVLAALSIRAGGTRLAGAKS